MEPIDETEGVRRRLVSEVNADPGSRPALEAKHGRVWDLNELSLEFEILGFSAPLVVVKRRVDGVKGSVMFQHSPRFYFGFEEYHE